MRGASTGAVEALVGGRAVSGTASVSKSATSGLLAPPTISTNGGFLAPPANHGQGGSIALRAMRSVRSLARMGSWAQCSGKDNAKEKATTEKKKDATMGKKDGKDKKIKSKTKKTEHPENAGKSKKSKSKTSKTKSKPKTDENADPLQAHAQTLRLSMSSFEVGALDASPVVSRALGVSSAATALGMKKRSTLGLGLPSTIRLPSVRSGSSASSVLVGVGPAPPFAAATTTSGIVVGNGNGKDNHLCGICPQPGFQQPSTTFPRSFVYRLGLVVATSSIRYIVSSPCIYHVH